MPTNYWQNVVRGRLSRRRALTGLGGAGLGAAFLAACGSDDSSGPTGGTGTSTGATGGTGGTGGSSAGRSGLEAGTIFNNADLHTLVYDTDNAVDGGTYPGRSPDELFGAIDPITETHNSTRRIGREVYGYLLERNFGPGIVLGSPDSLIMNPHGASAWQISPDGLTYTFTLRKGVKFHNLPPVNGREMNLDDWRTSLERFLDSGAYRGTLAGVLDSHEYPDDETMVWHMSEPFAPLLTMLDQEMAAFALMPAELNADPQLAATTAIGTSHRMLVRNETSVGRDYVRHEEYWKGRPYIEKWNFPVIPEYANAQAQFVAQNIINFIPSAQDVLRFRGDVPDAVLRLNEPSYNAPNLRYGQDGADEEPWHDVRVRIALRRAVNYELFTDILSNKAAFDAAGIDMRTTLSTHAMSDPAYWLDPREGELGEASQNYLFDLDEAKKLLEAAGYPDGFQIKFVSNADPSGSATFTPAWYERNDLLAREYEQTGLFTTNMEMQPYLEFNSNTVRWEHRGLLMGYNIQGADIDAGIYRQYHSSNSPAYGSPEMDSILEAQRREMDTERRMQLLKDWQFIAAEQFPSLPCWGSANTYSYEWPWLHNMAGWRAADYWVDGHLHWLAADMPRRDR